MQIDDLANNVYNVHSASSDSVYVIDLNNCKCTCTDWAIQRNKLKGAAERIGEVWSGEYKCKHITAVERKVGSAATAAVLTRREGERKKASEEAAKKIRDDIVARFTKQSEPKVVLSIEALADAAARKKT